MAQLISFPPFPKRPFSIPTNCFNHSLFRSKRLSFPIHLFPTVFGECLTTFGSSRYQTSSAASAMRELVKKIVKREITSTETRFLIGYAWETYRSTWTAGHHNLVLLHVTSPCFQRFKFGTDWKSSLTILRITRVLGVSWLLKIGTPFDLKLCRYFPLLLARPNPPNSFRVLRPVNHDAMLLAWTLPKLDEFGRSNGLAVKGYKVRWIVILHFPFFLCIIILI